MIPVRLARQCALLLPVLLSLLTAALPAAAQNAPWPSRPIRIIVTGSAGGPHDLTARVIGESMERLLGVPIVVEPRLGANGTIGMTAVVRAAPDGYTLGLGASSTLVTNHVTAAEPLPYSVSRDLILVGNVVSYPLVLIANRDFAPRRIDEIVGLAARNPDKVSYGTAGIGGGGMVDLTFTYLSLINKVRFFPVPYKSNDAPVAQAVGAGEINLGLIGLATALPMVEAGRARLLAVASDQRLAILPDVPTAAEIGGPGFESDFFLGLVAPARTPAAIVNTLNDALNKTLAQPEVIDRLRKMSGRVRSGTPQQFQAFIASETKKWSCVYQAGQGKIPSLEACLKG